MALEFGSNFMLVILRDREAAVIDTRLIAGVVKSSDVEAVERVTELECTLLGVVVHHFHPKEFRIEVAALVEIRSFVRNVIVGDRFEAFVPRLSCWRRGAHGRCYRRRASSRRGCCSKG